MNKVASLLQILVTMRTRLSSLVTTVVILLSLITFTGAQFANAQPVAPPAATATHSGWDWGRIGRNALAFTTGAAIGFVSAVAVTAAVSLAVAAFPVWGTAIVVGAAAVGIGLALFSGYQAVKNWHKMDETSKYSLVGGILGGILGGGFRPKLGSFTPAAAEGEALAGGAKLAGEVPKLAGEAPKAAPSVSAFERYGNLRAKDFSGPTDPRLLEIYQEQVVATQRMANKINSTLEQEGIQARVSPNTKTPESLYKKLVSKAEKKDYPLSSVTDMSRGRIDVTTNDLAEVARIDQVLRNKFGLTPDSDASPNFLQRYHQAETPTSGYSRSHLVLNDAANPGEAQFELQVGTKDLSEFIDAKVGKTTPHDAIYKGDVLGIELQNKGPLGDEYNNLLLAITALNKAGKSVADDPALLARIAAFKASVLDGLPEGLKVADAPALPSLPGTNLTGMVPPASNQVAAANGGVEGGWNGGRTDGSIASVGTGGAGGPKGSAGMVRNGSSL